MQAGFWFSRYKRWSEAAMCKAIRIDYIVNSFTHSNLGALRKKPAEAKRRVKTFSGPPAPVCGTLVAILKAASSKARVGKRQKKTK
jgi:hypothetical protein